MLSFARRPGPQRRPIGAPGLSEEQCERIRARLLEDRVISAFSRFAGGKSPFAAATYLRDSTIKSRGTSP